jgi:hypothetical protein
MHVFNIDLSLTFHLPGGPKAAFGSAEFCSVYSKVLGFSSAEYSQKAHDHSSLLVSPTFLAFFLAHTHTGVVISTRVHVSADVIISCYLVLIACSLLHPHPYNYPSRIVHCVALGRLVTLAHALIDTLCIPWPFLLTQYIISPV